MAAEKNQIVPIVETDIHSADKKESDPFLKENRKDLENSRNELLQTNKLNDIIMATEKKENDEIINTLTYDAEKLIQNDVNQNL